MTHPFASLMITCPVISHRPKPRAHVQHTGTQTEDAYFTLLLTNRANESSQRSPTQETMKSQMPHDKPLSHPQYEPHLEDMLSITPKQATINDTIHNAGLPDQPLSTTTSLQTVTLRAHTLDLQPPAQQQSLHQHQGGFYNDNSSG